MKKRLLLINPNFIRKIEGQTPLNLAYLAAAVEKYADVKIVDLNVEPEQNLYNVLKEFNPTHVGVARYTPNSIDSIKLLRKIHSAHPKSILITGGPHEIYRGHITKEMYPWINYVVRDKNGEQQLARILCEDESIIVNWKEIFPAYYLLNMSEQSYRFASEIFPGKKMLQYMTARGCTMGCSFCPSGRYEAKEVKIVIGHLEKIIDMGYNAVFFNDVNFAADPVRTEQLMKAMLEKGLNKKLEWGCQTTANQSLSDDLIKLMAKAGCSYITYSLENVSKEALQRINKRIDPETVMHKCIVAKKAGMKLGLYVMFGILNDETDDFYWAKKTLDKVAEIKPDFVSYSILAHYPNYNPSLPYETKRFGTEKVWEFFDEGCAYHPFCSPEYAEKIKKEILKRHRNELREVRKF